MASKDNDLQIFGLIGDFVQQLSLFFDAKSHLTDENLIKLVLYERLIEKTGPTNVVPISKHLNLFKEWVSHNLDACQNSDILLLNDEFSMLKYSDNVVLPLNQLLYEIKNRQGEKDVLTLMWKHILNIGFKLTKDSKIKERLIYLYSVKQKNDNVDEQKSTENTECDDSLSNEEKLFEQTVNDIKSEIEHMSGVETPTDAILQMSRNGTFEKLLCNFTQGMEKGTIDIPKMLNLTLQKSGFAPNGMDMSSIMKLMGGGASSDTEKENIIFDEYDFHKNK